MLIGAQTEKPIGHRPHHNPVSQRLRILGSGRAGNIFQARCEYCTREFRSTDAAFPALIRHEKTCRRDKQP